MKRPSANPSGKSNTYSPREYMRSRRPERFSDSVVSERPLLDRSILEYHLETLTSRNQESDFEQFCRELAKREITPNLLSHTGPTGGGDSKVDTETFPVAESLTYAWTHGSIEGASERWAVAISAKKAWKAKCKADIAKAVGTERGYTKVFFITNQFVSDKDRAAIEKQLSQQYGIDVRVYDRGWILDRVFTNRREDLAIEFLLIPVTRGTATRKGPLDLQRETELSELESTIAQMVEKIQFGPPLVDLAIDAATVSRSLELPRFETDGRFDRAERMARDFGNAHQRIHAAYERGWTAYFWHEDFGELSAIYDRLEASVTSTRNIQQLQWLSNLWALLNAHSRRFGSEEDKYKLNERTQVLRTELIRLGSEQGRPSAALEAREYLLTMDLAEAAPEINLTAIAGLKDVIAQADGLIGFPVEPLVRIISELGEVLADVPEYAELFEMTLKAASARQEEVVAGRLLVRRAAQLTAADKPIESIRHAGRALARLYKEESKDDLIRALFILACAYQKVGLTWAARGTMSIAASLATNDFWRHNTPTRLQFICCRRMRWLELSLGRVFQSLAWHEVAKVCGAAINATNDYTEDIESDDRRFDVALGLMLLRTPFQELRKLEQLPDVLDGLELGGASIAALYALGHPSEFGADNAEGAPEASVQETFERWASLAGSEKYPDHPNFCDSLTLRFSSQLMGCRVEVECVNSTSAVALVEILLATLESLFATLLVDGSIAREPLLRIRVRTSDFAECPFRFAVSEHEGRPELELVCRTLVAETTNGDEQISFKDKLREVAIAVMGQILLVDDVDGLLRRLLGEDRGFERAIDFAAGIGAIYNVLGSEPKLSPAVWLTGAEVTYPVNRTEPWNPTSRPESTEKPSLLSDPPIEPGDQEETSEWSTVRHSQVQVFSLIRETLWERAEWGGTAFLWSPKDFTNPPCIGLIFGHQEAGIDIFRNWRAELGDVDAQDQLQIRIIRGIDNARPFAYRVMVTTNPSATSPDDPTKFVFVVSRINTMEPDSCTNLDGFLRHFERTRRYVLFPATWTTGTKAPEFLWQHFIGKTEIHIRHAWEVGRHDLDASAIRPDDDPIIPSATTDAPVVELLAWLKDKEKARHPRS